MNRQLSQDMRENHCSIYILFKSITAKKKLALFWVEGETSFSYPRSFQVHVKCTWSWIRKRSRTLMGPSRNTKKEGGPVIVVNLSLLLNLLFNFVVLSLYWNEDIPYVKYNIYFLIKIRQLLWYESLQFILVSPLYIYQLLMWRE